VRVNWSFHSVTYLNIIGHAVVNGPFRMGELNSSNVMFAAQASSSMIGDLKKEDVTV